MKVKNVVIIDYGIGNVKSIANALTVAGANPILSKDHKTILDSDYCILPGVGAFTHGMKKLEENNLLGILKEYVSTGKPFMGICLGMQLLFEYSDEFGRTDGLSFIKGGVKKMPIQKGSGERLPHVSWNEIHAPSDKRWANTVLNNISENENVYFVHSYVCVPDEKSTILATTKYGGVEFCSAVQVDNVTGLQFHPEKSAEKGLQIIKNFIQ